MPPVSAGTPHSPLPKNVLLVEACLKGSTNRLEEILVGYGVDTYHRLLGDAWASRSMRENHAYVFCVGSAPASRAVFGALAEHTIRSAGRRPVQPTRPP